MNKMIISNSLAWILISGSFTRMPTVKENIFPQHKMIGFLRFVVHRQLILCRDSVAIYVTPFSFLKFDSAKTVWDGLDLQSGPEKFWSGLGKFGKEAKLKKHQWWSPEGSVWKRS